MKTIIHRSLLAIAAVVALLLIAMCTGCGETKRDPVDPLPTLPATVNNVIEKPKPIPSGLSTPLPRPAEPRTVGQLRIFKDVAFKIFDYADCRMRLAVAYSRGEKPNEGECSNPLDAQP